MKEVKEAEAVKTEPAEVVAKKPMPAWLPWVACGLAGVLLMILGYFTGYQVGTYKADNNYRGAMNNSMMRGGDDHFGGHGGYGPADSSANGRTRGMRGVVGEVTAVSSSSITLKDTMRGGTTTFTVDGNTKVTDNTGATKAIADIKTGNTVRVQAASSDSSIAGTIVIGTN